KGGGLYHGERIDVSKDDPGQILRKRLMSGRAGPRVVLHLAGAGKQLIEPIRIQGVDRVVLFFEPAPDGAEPLTLALKPGSSTNDEALITVEDGSLEVIGGRFNQRDASPLPQLFRVRGRELLLHRCRFYGPLQLSPEKEHVNAATTSAECLIRFEPQSPKKDA